MVVEVLQVGHGKLIETQTAAPVALDDAVDHFPLAALSGLEVGVELLKRREGPRWRVKVVFIFRVVLVFCWAEVRCCKTLVVLVQPVESNGEEGCA